ncbi:hypothetical protein GR328_12780 [Microvirga makkahensis]|uniref:Anti-sigma factor NepR domain-containing protein n=1 Tax=Microvirga makkahensis TaxID=1128670 RepID=A0A7X3SPC5_9HYPH|nr:hypothetical protein [Microvirga makkahensis]
MLNTPPRHAQQESVTCQLPETASGKSLQDPTLPPLVAAGLGERLRAHYAQLMNDPVPEALLRILKPLNEKGRVDDGR